MIPRLAFYVHVMFQDCDDEPATIPCADYQGAENLYETLLKNPFVLFVWYDKSQVIAK